LWVKLSDILGYLNKIILKNWRHQGRLELEVYLYLATQKHANNKNTTTTTHKQQQQQLLRLFDIGGTR